MSSSAGPPSGGFPLRRRLLLLVSALGGDRAPDGVGARSDAEEACVTPSATRSERDLRPAVTSAEELLSQRLTTLLVLTLAFLATLVLLLHPALQRLVVGPARAVRAQRPSRRPGPDRTVLACRRTLTDAPLEVGVQRLRSPRGVS